MVSLVIANRSVVLYAVSGAGKSSLLRAGVAVTLAEQGFEVLGPARLQSPVAPPREALNAYAFATIRSLRARGGDPDAESQTDPALTLSDYLAGLPRGEDAYGFPSPRVLILDQFEEVFTLYQDRWTQRTDFLRQLADALEHDPELRLLIALREEYLAELERHADALPGLLRARFHLERLLADAALAAVTCPLALRGVEFEPDLAETLVHDLRETRIDVGGAEPLRVEGEFVEPVQLQVVCRTLWLGLDPRVRRVTPDDLAALGNVDESLGRYYDDAVAAAATAAHVPEHRLRDAVERTLITSAGTRATVFAGERETTALPPAALEELASRHVVRAEWRAGGRWYELAHDRLIEPIRRSNEPLRARRRTRRLALYGAGAVLLTGIVVAVAVLFVLGPKQASVPNLVGKRSVFAAEQALVQAGLILSSDTKQQVNDSHRPGTVLAQTPAAGARAKPGSAVTVLIAVAPHEATVPSVVGLTLTRADRALRAAGLSLGQASPAPIRPSSLIASQIPAAGQVVKGGTSVNVFVTGSGSLGGEVPRPAAGDTAASFASGLAVEGLVPVVRLTYSDVTKGGVVRTVPKAGTALKGGDKVMIFASAGPPQLAYDTGREVRLVDSATGRPLGTAAHGTSPAWSPDGSRLAYVRGGRLWLTDLSRRRSSATPITPAGQTYADPAWAQTGEADVIAAVSVNGPDRRLCVGRLTGRRLRLSCKPQSGLVMGHALHWSPDGRTLLAFGRTSHPLRQGIVRWTSRKPFSANPADWSQGQFVTTTKRRGEGVFDAAISPDGKTLAVATNLGGAGSFKLYLTEPGDFAFARVRRTGVLACRIAWRGDSREIVVQDSGNACNTDTTGAGQLVAVSVRSLRARPLVAPGDHPTFPPLEPGG